MKYIQKYLFVVLFSVIALFIAVFGASIADRPTLSFQVRCAATTEVENISVFDAGDGNQYVFLPSYADIGDVVISLPGKANYSLAGTSLHDGMDCSGFGLEMPYDYSIDGQKVATLWFYRSANVATLYIDTASGDMKRIHKDKDHKEAVSIVLVSADGARVSVENDCYLKGRGNSTWELDKKPYSLNIPQKADLLGMGAASNWVLLANVDDATNLRNKLAFELAERSGLAWTPQSAYVDLYLNGDYNGTYLLTERVEIHPSRLDLDVDGGEFLCEVEHRKDTIKYPLSTPSGRTMGIVSAQLPIVDHMDTIGSLVSQMEQIILSEDDLSLSANFDLDSWVRRYLIDEILYNVDSDAASSFFYYSDGVFYAGPVWDYDLTLGTILNLRDPSSLVVDQLVAGARPRSPYYHALYHNASFYDRMVELYRTTFLPILEDMLNGGIADLGTEISATTAMNRIRWHSLFKVMSGWNTTIEQTPEELTHILSSRIDLLSDVWSGDTQYCSVNFQTAKNSAYWNIKVEKGRPVVTDQLDLEGQEWVCEDTGEVFDFSQPIQTDMRFILRPSGAGKDGGPIAAFVSTLATRDILVLMSIAALLFLFSAIVIADVKNKKR